MTAMTSVGSTRKLSITASPVFSISAVPVSLQQHTISLANAYKQLQLLHSLDDQAWYMINLVSPNGIAGGYLQ